MNDHTKKVAKAGFAWLTIFSAVVLFFPLAYQILPESLQESKPFTLAYSFVSAFWMMATVATAIKSTVDADSQAWLEYYDSLPESGDGDDGDEGEGEGDGDGEDEEGGDDDDVEWESDDTEVIESDTSGEPTDEQVQSAINSLATPDSGFVRADSIKPNPHQTGIQVFRVPGGTLKPGS